MAKMPKVFMTKEVTITWLPEDIQSIRPEWGLERCEEALDSISKSLQDRSIELGWGVIECLLPEESE